MRRAVGKKMLSLAGPTAGAAGRDEVLRGEVWGVGGMQEVRWEGRLG